MKPPQSTPTERLKLAQDTCVSSFKFEVLLRVMVRKGDIVHARASGSSDSGVEFALLLHDNVAKFLSFNVGPFDVLLSLEATEAGVVKFAMRVPSGVGLACVHAKTSATEFADLKLWRPS